MTTTPPGPAGGPAGGGVSPLIRRLPSSGLFTTSDFESMSHEQLRAMIEHADAETTSALGAKLTSAAGAMTKLGERLKEHASGVEWEGLGGDAFREWVADMANATLRLSDFSKNAGSWMTHAAATLAGVQSAMPAVSSTSQATLAAYKASNPGQVGAVPAPTLSDQSGGLQKAGASGPSQKEAYAAQTQLDADRAEAARLMRKLAESYAWSARNISGAGAPTFPPMPGAPGDRVDREYISPVGASAQGVYSPGGMATGAQGGGVQGVAPVSGLASGIADVGASSGSVVSATQPLAKPVSVEVDGGVAVPEAPVLPSGGAPAPLPHGGGTSNTSLVAPVAGLPVPPMGHVPAGLGGGKTGPVGGQRQGTVPGIPGRGLVGGPGSVPGLPRDGVVGGRPAPRTSAQVPTQVPRGTVIGTEPGQARTPMGFGAPHAAPPGSPAGRVGAGSGRRLAFEPGGVVGGSGQRRNGASGDRAFTPGGSGLVRSPGGDLANHGRRTSQQGQRPDYLVEDEETWSQGNRRVAPPVID